jgi:hypothetical protein
LWVHKCDVLHEVDVIRVEEKVFIGMSKKNLILPNFYPLESNSNIFQKLLGSVQKPALVSLHTSQC